MQQNVTGAYVIIMLVCRRLLTTRLHGKAAVSYQIKLEKQQKLFVQGYNLKVHDVIKYTRKHRATKCYRRLRNNYGKSAVSYQITLEKQQKLFVKGYNLEVRDVIK